jgi:hypothetical protein
MIYKELILLKNNDFTEPFLTSGGRNMLLQGVGEGACAAIEQKLADRRNARISILSSLAEDWVRCLGAITAMTSLIGLPVTQRRALARQKKGPPKRPLQGSRS